MGKAIKRKKGLSSGECSRTVEKRQKENTCGIIVAGDQLSVFYCLTTMISSQGERTVLPNYWNADFTIQNQTQTTEEIHSLRPVIEESLLEEIENMDGVKDIHVTEGVPVCFPYEPEGFSDLWIRNYIERTPYLSAEEIDRGLPGGSVPLLCMLKA